MFLCWSKVSIIQLRMCWWCPSDLQPPHDHMNRQMNQILLFSWQDVLEAYLLLEHTIQLDLLHLLSPTMIIAEL